MIASLGLAGPHELHPAMLMRRIDHVRTASYAELYDWLDTRRSCWPSRQRDWAADWQAAETPDSFRRICTRRGHARMPTVAEMIVTALADQGVRTVWGVVGDALNPVTDAIRREERSSGSASGTRRSRAFAAGAQAQLTGTLGVCMGTVGPGSMHLLNGLYDAKKSHAPVLAICGQVPLAETGHRLLPGGRQRPAVPRRRRVQPHDHLPRAGARRCSSRRVQAALNGPGRRRADAARRRRRAGSAQARPRRRGSSRRTRRPCPTSAALDAGRGRC